MPRTTDRRSTSSRRRLDPIAIECVTPELDSGRFPVKRVVGDLVEVAADIFRDGHDLLAARIAYRPPGDGGWLYVPMRHDFDLDRWFGSFVVDRAGKWTFSVEGWTDTFADWRRKLEKKLDAEQDVGPDLLIGAEIIRAASRSVKGAGVRASLVQTAKVLEDRREMSVEQKTRRALDDDILAIMNEHHKPADRTRYSRDLTIVVDRERARFGAWYELFPRSQGTGGAPGTFADAGRRLPRLAELGFDIVYLAPIHPIGRRFRKGKNNSVTAEPDDVGSPWAIGNEQGGHTAVDPALGTLADFDQFVRTAGELGVEIALDYALQCSPDHPWVKEHPDWFHVRPDGTIAHAENPPKKYQDIYPLNFWCEDRKNLWNACRDIFLFWIGHGIRIFRVDNPHTKPFPFWEWVIGEIQAAHPDVLFLSEAFARPKTMKYLAKLGFTMSYTYFTWRNAASEIREYLQELTRPPTSEYFRGNLFANTPDILTDFLVHGGPPAFRIRLLLAATLMPSYGIYSGFELCENVPVRPGSEEYLDSEKYEIKPRDWEAPGNLNSEIQRINEIRRENRALQLHDNLHFARSENEAVLFYRKSATGEPGTGTGDLLIAVTTDPHHPQETMVHVPVADMGIAEGEEYVVHDLLTGAQYTWRGSRNYVRLDPQHGPVGHVLRLERTPQSRVPSP
jgi:starch synthase (maltosyl-transferring)